MTKTAHETTSAAIADGSLGFEITIRDLKGAARTVAVLLAQRGASKIPHAILMDTLASGLGLGEGYADARRRARLLGATATTTPAIAETTARTIPVSPANPDQNAADGQAAQSRFRLTRVDVWFEAQLLGASTPITNDPWVLADAEAVAGRLRHDDHPETFTASFSGAILVRMETGARLDETSLRALVLEEDILASPHQIASITALTFSVKEDDVRIEADFRPQAWIRDNAVTVDAPGETCFDMTDAVCALLINLSQTAFVIEHGMRIAQLILEHIATPDVVEVDSLDETTRGAGGFGSTGL